MKFVVILAAVAVAVSATTPQVLHQEWGSFKIAHQKQYMNAAEEAKRFAIFKDNLAKIEAHNAKYEQGLVTFKMGVNQFADMTAQEFLAYVNRTKAPELPQPRKNIVVPKTSNLGAQSVDWRNNGVVTGVKNQGQCGSCWSFSATGALEGQYALGHNQLVSLSEQNLMDCSSNYGNAGCNGGWMDSAFQYVMDNGINTEDSYPYEASVGRCRYSGQSVLRVTNYLDFSPEPSNVKLAVEQYGPLAVAIDATENLQLYSSGILVDNSCSANALNHGVLAVGFGPGYWLVKNSWGASWGENGYFRISDNGDACGLTTASSVPVVA